MLTSYGIRRLVSLWNVCVCVFLMGLEEGPMTSCGDKTLDLHVHYLALRYCIAVLLSPVTMSLLILPRRQHARSIFRHTRIIASPCLTPARARHASPPKSEEINNLAQGHVTNPENVHPEDVYSQSTRGGFRARKDEKNEGIDAANEYAKAGDSKKPRDMGKGNPEGVGFVEQVGGASGSARKFEEENKRK